MKYTVPREEERIIKIRITSRKEEKKEKNAKMRKMKKAKKR